MPLFQSTVVTKYLNSQDQNLIDSKWELFKDHFHNPSIQENIRNSNEEQYQGEFLIDLFVNVLGYTKNPTPDFNLTTEYKNVKDSKKADGAIIIDGRVKAVIELKGTETTDLSKIETQAFGYKNNQPDCAYVVTANFEKLRFYIDNATEHIEFNLFQLTKENFQLLFLCLGYENIAKDTPRKLKNESLSKEDEITNELYKDYSVFKRELHSNLVKLNPQFDPLTLFKKSQKLLDRFLFLFFAEDRLLLPPNSVRLVLSDYEDLKERDEYKPLYDRFKKYFGYLNTGYKGKRYDVYPYNGGLFKPDEVLDEVTIDDKLLYNHTLKLSEYDFESEVDVNILGHIFENSLTEIEQVQAELEGQSTDKSKSKRKKDGVFYTPKYITKYIVENTVGKLCEEKKVELDITDENYQPAKQRSRKRLDNLQQYRDWLLQITICDPACGSGAFLNQVLEYLIAEHQYIDELSAKYNKDALILSDVENSILENNLFGVDINEESVEIAKLSLWLRTAQRNRKLNDLSNNIKCGNSLIDDPEIAGKKVFNWKNEFPRIFEEGGFDIIIGNPPYGAKFSKIEIDYFNSEYRFQSYQLDSYLLFTERLIKWTKENGYMGYIMPNTWLSSLFGNNIRQFVFNSFEFKQLVHYSSFVFEDATVETDIYILKNRVPDKNHQINVQIIDKYGNEVEKKVFQKNWINLNGKPVNIYESEIASRIKTKLSNNASKLGDIVKIIQGTKPFQVGKGTPPQTKEVLKLKPYVQDEKIDDSFIPLLRGSLIHRYSNYWNGNYWISYGDWLAEPRYSAKFDVNEKIVIRQTGDSLIATFDAEQFIARDNLYVIRQNDDYSENIIKIILAILNSKFMTWYYRNVINPEKGKAMAQVKRGHLQNIPIVITQNDDIEMKVSKILKKNKLLVEHSEKFLRNIRRRFPELLTKLTKNLENWYSLSYADFIKELRKKKIILSLKEESDWEDYFLEEQMKALEIKKHIDQTDKEIDQMVYELYGLTEEEIEIVENG